MISAMGAGISFWGYSNTAKSLELSNIDPGVFTSNNTIATDEPIPVEPDGGIGDGAGPIGEDIIPVEPGGGIGDGAGPIPWSSPLEQDGRADDGSEPVTGPMPVEPDGGIGDGAGPIGDPMPVEPDGGIGDGAGPIFAPMPVEPDGGIGDGADPITNDNGNGGTVSTFVGGGVGTRADDTFIASEDSDVFIFLEDHGDDTILGFDACMDSLDFSEAEIDFTDLESLMAHAEEVVDPEDTSTVIGLYITTGEETGVYIEGLSAPDLASVDILF